MSDYKTRVAELLATLGETADDVAQSLRDRGITGEPESGDTCPIAMLIQREIPESAEQIWTVEGLIPGWFVVRTDTFTPDGHLSNPAAVREFIERFDDGITEYDGESYNTERPYADLEAEAER